MSWAATVCSRVNERGRQLRRPYQTLFQPFVLLLKTAGKARTRVTTNYIDRGLVAGVEGNKVRLSATGAVAVTMEEEKKIRPAAIDKGSPPHVPLCGGPFLVTLAFCELRKWPSVPDPLRRADDQRRRAFGNAGFIAPQLATLRSKAPVGGKWIHEIKYDGYRLQIHLVARFIQIAG
jgi:ATP-dependent DNA ligase